MPPPHPDDLRLADALRSRRPEAVGLAYNAHGPSLIGYAESLVGDREAAVTAVRSALARAGSGAEAGPEPGALREWLRDLVRQESVGRLTGAPAHAPPPVPAAPGQAPTLADFAPPEPVPPPAGPAEPRAAKTDVFLAEPAAPPRGRRRWGLVGAVGGAGAVLVTALAAATALPDSPPAARPQAQSFDGGPSGSPGPLLTSAAPRPTGSASRSPSGSPTASPSTTPSPTPSSPTPSPSGSKPGKRKPGDKPRRQGPGRLVVGDGGCQGLYIVFFPSSCGIRLTAQGGPVTWSVTSTSGRISAAGGGRLEAGASTVVPVRLRLTLRCLSRSGASGTVGFSPGATARISYRCAP